MLIISKFIDYYDKLSSIYGVDNKIVLNRNLELPHSVDVIVRDEEPVCLFEAPNTHPSYLRSWNNKLIDLCDKYNIGSFELLCVCGKPYLICEEKVDFSSVKAKRDKFVAPQELLDLFIEKKKSIFSGNYNYGIEYRYLKNISKLIKSPVFIITGKLYGRQKAIDMHSFYIQTKFPNFSEIKGFVKIYSAEQLYQDISYWIANIINESPDIQPFGKPPQSDVEKVISHGFDKKKSFRHRK